MFPQYHTIQKSPEYKAIKILSYFGKYGIINIGFVTLNFSAKEAIMRTLIIALILALTALIQGCATPRYEHGGVIIRSSGGSEMYYPPAQSTPPYAHPGYGNYGNYAKDVRVQTKEDEQGLINFRISESGLSEAQVDWVIKRVDDLKARCRNGGEMKRYEIESVERANLYSSARNSRGETTVRIEYQCNRGVGDKLAPRTGPVSSPTPPETKPAPLLAPRLKSGMSV